MTQSVSLNGMVVARARVHIPYRGVWVAHVDLDQAHDGLTGPATLVAGEASFVGSYVPELTGTWQQQSRAYLVGGAGGWRTSVAAKHYHSDSGVQARTVAQDLASLVGETLDSVTLTASLGIDHVRRAGYASEAMSAACGAVPWCVAADGKTNVGVRPAVEILGAYEVLELEPRFKIASVVTDDVSRVGIGSVLRNRLPAPLLVNGITVTIDPFMTRLACWCEEVAA